VCTRISKERAVAPKTSVFIATSLDGFIARQDGGLDWLDHDAQGDDYGTEFFFKSVDVLLMGRNTFEAVLSFGQWPYDGMDVVVMSRTQKDDAIPGHLKGKARFSNLGPREILAEVLEGGAHHVYIDGGRLIQSFLKENLVDELILTRLPILIGSGIPLFGPLEKDVPLTLVNAKSFASGVVQLTYRIES
jgi:dihydrofolate reductase